jgi:hypothetical protein
MQNDRYFPQTCAKRHFFMRVCARFEPDAGGARKKPVLQ